MTGGEVTVDHHRAFMRSSVTVKSAMRNDLHRVRTFPVRSTEGRCELFPIGSPKRCPSLVR